MAKKDKKPKKVTAVTKRRALRRPVGKAKAKTKVAKPKAAPEKKKRPAYKSLNIPECTIEQALQDAFSEIETLRDEMQEIVDNMSGMEHLPKYQTAEDAQQELDGHADCPDVPEIIKNKTIATLSEMVSTRKGRGVGRSMRLSNATSIIAAVADHIRTEPSYTTEEREAANDLADELEEHENVEVEFPGMYG